MLISQFNQINVSILVSTNMAAMIIFSLTFYDFYSYLLQLYTVFIFISVL